VVKRIAREALEPELAIVALRSSGPGGQHANKVSTKVQVRWNIRTTALLTAEEKLRFEKLVTAEDELVVSSQETRSQSTNKERAIVRLLDLVAQTLKVKKKRKATRPTPAAVRTRLQSKRTVANKKKNRGKRFDEGD
jgi:ribosome-associated protein